VDQINAHFKNVDVLQSCWLDDFQDGMTNLGLLHREALTVVLRRVFWRCFVNARLGRKLALARLRLAQAGCQGRESSGTEGLANCVFP
jgi:hypothetical protein